MAPRIDHYDWSGGREALLRFGPDTGPVVILALPLFEEANRTRTFAVACCADWPNAGSPACCRTCRDRAKAWCRLRDCPCRAWRAH